MGNPAESDPHDQASGQRSCDVACPESAVDETGFQSHRVAGSSSA